MFIHGQGTLDGDNYESANVRQLLEVLASMGFVAVAPSAGPTVPDVVTYAQQSVLVYDAIRLFLTCRGSAVDDPLWFSPGHDNVIIGHSRGGGAALVAVETLNASDDDLRHVTAAVTLSGVTSQVPLVVELGRVAFLSIYGTHDFDIAPEAPSDAFFDKVNALSKTAIVLKGVPHHALGPAPNSGTSTIPNNYLKNSVADAPVGRATRDFLIAEFLRKEVFRLPNLLDSYIYDGNATITFSPAGGIGGTDLIASLYRRNIPDKPAIPELSLLVEDAGLTIFDAAVQSVLAPGEAMVALEVGPIDTLVAGLPAIEIPGCDDDPTVTIAPAADGDETAVFFAWDQFLSTTEAVLRFSLAQPLDFLEPTVVGNFIQGAFLMLELALVVESERNQQTRDQYGFGPWRPRVGLGNSTGPQIILPTSGVHDAFDLPCPAFSSQGTILRRHRLTMLQTVVVPLDKLLPDGPSGVSFLYLFPYETTRPRGDAIAGKFHLTRPGLIL